MNIGTNYTLSLAPLLYPWNAKDTAEFYTTVAAIPEISRVYLGEIVCAKRSPLINKYLETIIAQLRDAGKQLVISTPILHNDSDSHQLMLDNIALARKHNLAVEINDLAAMKHAQGLPLIIGPYINTYNQGTLAVFARNGATLLCPPFESNCNVLTDLAKQDVLPVEINIFGRLPLSISSRCFIAHNLERERDDCKLVCMQHSQGFSAASDNDALFTLNGMQVQSAKIYNLINEIPELLTLGITNFRISPCREFSIAEIVAQIKALQSDQSLASFNSQHADLFANGFYHNQEGYKFITVPLNE